jgi:hypothetical protein
VKAAKKREPTTDAIKIIHRLYYQGHPQRIADLKEAEANYTIEPKIYELRKRTRLTQKR